MNPPQLGPGLPRHHQHQRLLHLHLDPRHHHHVHIHLCHHHHHDHGTRSLAPPPPACLHHHQQRQQPAPVFFPNANPSAAPWQPEPPPAAVKEDAGELDPEPGLLDAEAAEDEEEPVFVLTDEWAEFFAKSEAKRRLAKQQKKNKSRK